MTSGSYTVGSGGDYANWAAAAAATENLTGNLTFTQISDVTDNTAFAFNVALGGYTLTLTSNKRHNGNFRGGWKTTLSMDLAASAAACAITNSSSIAGAKFILDGLNIAITGSSVNSGARIFNLETASTNITNSIKNTIVDNTNKSCYVFRSGNSNCVTEVHNFIGQIVLYVTAHATSKIENSTLLNGNGDGFFWNYGNIALSAKNIFVGRVSGSCYAYGSGSTAGLGNTVANKCASTDNTGSEAGLRGLTASEQFLSVTLTDGDLFLKIKSTGVLDDGGVAPSIAANTTGIRGTARPHDTDKYSIGADEFKSTRPSVSIDGAPATHNGLSPFEITIEFSEEVVGFAVGDIGATNAELSGFAGSGDTYTVTVTPDGEDDITLSIAENVAVDLYANGNTAAEDVEVSYAAPGECCIGDSRLAVGIGIGF